MKWLKLFLIFGLAAGGISCATLNQAKKDEIKKEEIKEAESQKPIKVRSFSLIENQLIKREDVEKEITKYKEMIKAQKEEDEYLAFLYGELCFYYDLCNELDSALIYAQKSLKIYEKQKNKNGLCSIFFTLGEISEKKSDWLRAEEYYKRSYELMLEQQEEKIKRLEKIKNKELGYEYQHYGGLLCILGRYKEALEAYQKAHELYEKFGKPKYIWSLYENMMECCKMIGDFEKAEEYFQKYQESIHNE